MATQSAQGISELLLNTKFQKGLQTMKWLLNVVDMILFCDYTTLIVQGNDFYMPSIFFKAYLMILIILKL